MTWRTFWHFSRASRASSRSADSPGYLYSTAKALSAFKSAFINVRNLGPLLRIGSAGYVLKVFDARKLGKIFQPKLNQKLFRRAIHHRAAHSFLSALRYDQPFIKKRFDGRWRLHTTNLENLGHGHGLFISDDCQRFQRSQRQLRAWLRFQIRAHIFVVLGPSRDLPAPGNLAQLQTTRASIVFFG